MFYPKPIVTLPKELIVGSLILDASCGDDLYTITAINKDDKDNVIDIHHSGDPCPICASQLYSVLLSYEGENWNTVLKEEYEAYMINKNEQNSIIEIYCLESYARRIKVVRGKCDICEKKFIGACVYYKIDSRNICSSCNLKLKRRKKTERIAQLDLE